MRVFLLVLLAVPYSSHVYPVRRQISRHASQLRQDETDAERLLWSRLRNRQFGGFKFRRQWTQGRYIVDFVCLEAMVAVEADGGQHEPEKDAARTYELEQAGYLVLRFWNNDVLGNVEGVLEVILGVLLDRTDGKKKTLTQPSPMKMGEG